MNAAACSSSFSTKVHTQRPWTNTHFLCLQFNRRLRLIDGAWLTPGKNDNLISLEERRLCALSVQCNCPAKLLLTRPSSRHAESYFLHIWCLWPSCTFTFCCDCSNLIKALLNGSIRRLALSNTVWLNKTLTYGRISLILARGPRKKNSPKQQIWQIEV